VGNHLINSFLEPIVGFSCVILLFSYPTSETENDKRKDSFVALAMWGFDTVSRRLDGHCHGNG
jgi:hypothetical protein